MHVNAGDITNFMFTTPPHIVAPGSISKPITLQSVDASHSPVKVIETYDIVFTTSSHTGSFVSSVGKTMATSTSMRKNTSNRSVYYLDATPGNYLITARILSRTNNMPYVVTQRILVASTSSAASVTYDSQQSIVSKPESEQDKSHIAKPTQNSETIFKENMIEKVPALTSTTTDDVAAPIFAASSSPTFLHRIFTWPIILSNWIYTFVFGE